MKIKTGIHSLLIIIILVFSTCDLLDDNKNNGNDLKVIVEPLIKTK